MKTVKAVMCALFGVAFGEVCAGLGDPIVIHAGFSTNRAPRVQEEIGYSADLSRAAGIEFDFFCPDTDPVSGFNLYFESGKHGCYTAGFEPGPAGKWNHIEIDKSRVWTREGEVKGWKNIRDVRLGAWRVGTNDTMFIVKNIRPMVEEPEVVVVRGDSCKGFRPVHKPLSVAAKVVTSLRDIGIQKTVLVPDDDVADEVLAGVRLVVLPFNPTMPLTNAQVLATYVRRGGNLIVFNGKKRLPPPLNKLVAEGCTRVHLVGSVDAGGRTELRNVLKRVVAGINPVWADGFAAAEQRVVAREQAKAQWIAGLPKKANEFRAISLHRYTCDRLNEMGPHAWDAAVRLLRDCGYNAIMPHAAFARHLHHEPDCVAACRKYGVDCIAWKMCWRTGEKKVLRDDGMGRRMVGFDGDKIKQSGRLCPSDPRNLAAEVAQIDELCRLGYTIIGLDMIRYPDFNYCFCDGCREAFEGKYGRKVKNWPMDVRTDAELGKKWDAFRCENITALVREAAKIVHGHGLLLRASVFHTHDVCAHTVGQDWISWCRDGLLDMVSPMDYYVSSSFAFRGLVKSQLLKLKEVGSRAKLRPSVGLACWREPYDRDAIMATQVLYVRDLGLDGFGVFEYAQWVEDWLPLLAPWLGPQGEDLALDFRMSTKKQENK